MLTYKAYDVYCIEEASFRRVNSFTEPTQCPLIHNDRSIDSNQTILIDYIEIIPNTMEYLTPKENYISKKTYTDLKSDFIYNPDIITEILYIGFRTRFERKSSTGTYSIRIFDKTNNLELETTTINDPSLSNVSILLQSQPKNSVLEFHSKVEDSRDKIEIDKIIIYYR